MCVSKLSKLYNIGFLTTVLLMIFHALVSSELDFLAFFLLQITSPLLLPREKKVNWAIKSVYFRSNFEASFDFRTQKNILGIP